MATQPSRKKSLVGANGALPFIDIPQPSNQLLNKSASSSTSLYQRCSQLRAKLVRIDGFAPFLALASPVSAGSNRQSHSTDPVRQVWDCLLLGTPLVFLWNLIPGRKPIDINTNPEEIDWDNQKDRKRATAKFIIALTESKRDGEWAGEVFTITELHSETRDTNGFVKVVDIVARLVDMVPQEFFKPEEAPPSPPSLPTPFDPSSASGIPATPFDGSAVATPQEGERERNQVLRELIETERKYVADLEVMREYANALARSGGMDQDTIHHLFPGLNPLLDFQRQFLIVLEGIYEQPWHLQHWGNAFTSKEEEFAVYEPYCANYTNASELLQLEEQNLMSLSNMIDPRSELPAFLIKPVQRICKYPLLLEQLVKRAGPTYPHREELVEGLNAAKRITDRVNEAQRMEDNLQTVRALEQRVEDWKGHHLAHFGKLLLDEVFTVTKTEVDREYHVFLFEKIILCCKEAIPQGQSTSSGRNSKIGKNNSILKKNANAPPPPPGGVPGRKKNTPLLLKGRIFLNNITAATPSRRDGHALQVWWRGDQELEYFTLRCRTEEQLKQWETTLNRLIAENEAPRRPSHRGAADMAPPSASAAQTSYNPQQAGYPGGQPRSRYTSQSNSGFGGEFPTSPGTPNLYPNSLPYNPGLGLVNRERADSRVTDEMPTDDEGYFDDGRGYESPYSVNGGRATPSGSRRPHASMPASRAGAVPLPLNRTPMARGMSAGSDGSFVSGAPGAPATVGPPSRLRSQFSSARLHSNYEEQQSIQRTPMPGMAGVGAGGVAQSQQQQQQQHLRMRSASTPTAYNPNANPQVPPPPIPIQPSNASTASWSTVPSALASNSETKRGSGSSQSTNASSDYSAAQTTSPVTPYGSNDSTLALRPMRSQGFGGANGDDFSPPVKVKVHFREDLFVIVVQRSIDYQELMEKVGRKIRLCGAKHDNSPFRVRYKDEDGDMISLASNDDLQIALDSSQVVLYVV